MVKRLTWDEVSARRLERSHLTGPAGADLAQVAADLVGVHAQVMAAATLSLGLRTAGGSVADALWADRTLIKTRGPRGTVHLLAARDLPMWIGVLSAGGSRALPATQTDEIVAAIADAVGGDGLTVEELTDAIVERVGAWAGERTMDAFQDKWPRWRMVEAVASNRGAMCFGPSRGRRTTYVRPPAFPALGFEEASRALVQAFLHAYGPATPAQLERWLGRPLDPGADVETVDFDGVEALVNAGDVEGGTIEARGVRLLPYFDSFLIGCHPRSRLFPAAAADRALNRGQAGNFPVVLVDGQVAGVWHHHRSTVTVELLRAPTNSLVRALAAEVERIGLASPPILGPVTAGPHA